jgi:ribose transport system ATP-binding protein
MLTGRNISKSFVGIKALKDVSIEVRPHEVVGLIGENGAGKSTLMRILSGTYRPDSGEISLDGAPIALRNARDAASHGIGMVFQEQSLLLNLSVAENIYLGREDEFVRHGLLDWRRLYAAARRQLDKVGLDVRPGTRTSELSFAARQMVELAKALALEERSQRQLIILLDEPTSVLERADIERLFRRVRALKGRASFVFVSHRLHEVLELSDRVYVMKDGEVVAERAADRATVPELHQLMVGRGLHAEYYREARQKPPGDEVVLEASGLTVEGAYHRLDFALHAGEILGIAGVIGSGREEVARTLVGFLPQTSGVLRVQGREVCFRTPAEAVACGIGYIPRERRVEGLVMFLSVAANITLARLGSVMRHGIIDLRRERALAQDWIGRLNIRTPNSSTPCRNLSGGNQQKVVIARWLTAMSRILVLDHPTRGLDVGAKEEVYELIRNLSDEGVAIVLTSDTLEETIGLCHAVLVMRDGEMTARFEAPRGGKPDQIDIVRHMV